MAKHVEVRPVTDLKSAVKPEEKQKKQKVQVQEAPAELIVENPKKIGLKVTLPDNLIPKALTARELPRQPYWGGTIKNNAFHSTRVAGFAFPYSSFENPAARGPMNHKLGTLMMLTDDEVQMILRKSVQVGWRRNVVEKRARNGKKVVVSDTMNPVHYDANNPPLHGDKLTAHYIYLRKLKHGQKIPLGLQDSEGDDLPTPKPLVES
jgi:hypothetical protein